MKTTFEIGFYAKSVIPALQWTQKADDIHEVHFQKLMFRENLALNKSDCLKIILCTVSDRSPLLSQRISIVH